MALLSDLRSAFKALVAARGFTVLAVTTLGIGLALCIIVLTVMNAYLIRGLPYPAADRLYRLDLAAPGQNPPRGLETLDWASLDDVIEHQIAWDLDVYYMLGGEFPESAPGAWVTPGYMNGLGVRTAMGRVFDAGDYRAGSPAVAIISHRLWQTRFGGDRAVVGRTFQAYVSDRPNEAETFTIVGVLAQEMWHFNVYSEVLAPLRAPSYPYIVRLRPGVPADLAAERITALARAGVAALPESWRASLTSQHASYVATVRPLLWAVGAGAALVLLIAAANVAVLLLVRARRRERELAVRLALGASHARIATLLAIEGILLGLASTIVGVVSSRTLMQSLAPFIEQFLERRVPGGVDAFAQDATVLMAASACGVLITLTFTLIPLAVTWRSTMAHGLGSMNRGSTDGQSASRTRAVLIGVEVAASLTLLAGAALMAESAVRMLRVDFGIRADDVVTASLSLRQRSYPDAASRAQFYERLSGQLANVAGARAVALSDSWPLQPARPRRVETAATSPASAETGVVAVSGDYFAVLDMTVSDGRTFAPQDQPTSPAERGKTNTAEAKRSFAAEPVVIVSHALAQRLWPGQRAVDQLLTIPSDEAGAALVHRVVGVVNDVRQTHADTDLFDAYVSLRQRPGRFAFIYVRDPQSSSWETDLRAAVVAVDREVALGAPRWLEAGLEQERARPRFLAFFLATFAGFACVLALVGMHGVIAYAVRQREREIAIRIAMGARASAITSLFVRQGTAVLLAGIVAGLGGAVALGRVLQSQLYGVQAVEPRILAASALAFAMSGLLAVWWPAWRAASTDPALVLKES